MAAVGCRRCRSATPLAFNFTFAFQPIVDAARQEVFAYEALVRGTDGGGADSVLSRVSDDNRYVFDQGARVRAIELAARLMPEGRTKLSINFMPNAVYDPALCLRMTLQAAEETGFSQDRLMFELTEDEQVVTTDHLRAIIDHYSASGFTVAIDDFGAGYAGLRLFGELDCHVVKLDRALAHGIDRRPRQQTIVRSVIEMADRLGVVVIAEGIETPAEYAVLRNLGARFFQGYLFARPALEALPPVDFRRIEALRTDLTVLDRPAAA